MAAETLIAGPILPDFGAWPLMLLTLLAVLSARKFSEHQWQAKAAYALTIAVAIFVLSLLAERYRLAHLDATPALLLVVCSIAAQYVIGMMQKIATERRIDSETGLPNLIAWQDRSDAAVLRAVVVAEIANFGEIASTLGKSDASKFIRSVGRPIGCAINISASLFLDNGFAERAISIINKSRVDPASLTFELTETAVLSSVELAASTLRQFREIGLRLSIDDYGTGQSTLTYLKSFAADEIKIDQSFVKRVATDNANRIMVRSSIDMAHALGMAVVAEGVEDEEAMNLLREFGCDLIQGWHIGKAVSRDEFIRCWCQPDVDNVDVAPLVRQVFK